MAMYIYKYLVNNKVSNDKGRGGGAQHEAKDRGSVVR